MLNAKSVKFLCILVSALYFVYIFTLKEESIIYAIANFWLMTTLIRADFNNLVTSYNITFHKDDKQRSVTENYTLVIDYVVLFINCMSPVVLFAFHIFPKDQRFEYYACTSLVVFMIIQLWIMVKVIHKK